MRILNGRTPGDRRGNLTRFPLSLRESPSTLDYIASDIPTMKVINTLTVMPHLGLSDHCSLCVSINTKFSCTGETVHTIHREESLKYVSNPKFLMKLHSPAGKEKLNLFLSKHENANSESVESLYTDFLDVVNSLARENPCSQPRTKKRNRKRDKKKHKPWYTSKCRLAKTALNRAEKN